MGEPLDPKFWGPPPTRRQVTASYVRGVWLRVRDRIVGRKSRVGGSTGRGEEAVIAYVVTQSEIESHEILRVYTDRDEAQRFADAYGPTASGSVEVEEWPVGRPDVAYDGPYWEGSWRDHFQNGQRYAGPSFTYRLHWHSGEALPEAEVIDRMSGLQPFHPYHCNHPYVAVRGTSRDHVQALVEATAAEVEAERSVGVAPTEEK